MNNSLSLIELAPVFSNVKKCVQFLCRRNLLKQDEFCCNQQCSKVMDISLSDREIFQCRLCYRHYSIRNGSFWSKSKLKLTMLLAIVYFFSQDIPVTQCVKLLIGNVTKKSVIQWYNYCRDVTSTFFARNRIIFDQVVVHCDESFIGGKRKYNRGRVPNVQPRWVFGIIDNVNHKCFIQFVAKRDINTIIPIITRHVRPGCTINTDGAKIYKHLDYMNYTHNSVNHKDNYVDPVTGHHSNWVENLWSNLKIKLKSIRGSQGNMLDGHDEYMYWYNRKSEGDLFNILLDDISLYYPM